MTEEQIEAAAQAAWQKDFTDAVGRPHLIQWPDESENIKDRWRGLMRAALAAAEAAVRPTHTDLMVTPEQLDEWLEENPPPPVYEWQPISTLEHGHIDDSKVILPSGRPCPAAFESDHVLLVTAGHGRPWVGQSMIVSGVLIGWGGPAPTHWMPLPKPPKETSDD